MAYKSHVIILTMAYKSHIIILTMAYAVQITFIFIGFEFAILCLQNAPCVSRF